MQFDKDLNSEQAELFLDVREFVTDEIEKYVQKVTEKYSENITSLFSKEFSGGFCYLRVKDSCVHIGWFCGVNIVDKHGLLFGSGKQIRGQKVCRFTNKEKVAISSYVEQSYLLLVEKKELKKMGR